MGTSVLMFLQEVTYATIKKIGEGLQFEATIIANKTKTSAIILPSDWVAEGVTEVDFPETETKLNEEITVLKCDTRKLFLIGVHFSSKGKGSVKPGILKNTDDQLVVFNEFLT
jgi:hypothetical protein